MILMGHDLTIPDLVHVSRQLPPNIRFSDASINRMARNRAFAETIADRGDQVYGLTTGVGVRKKRIIPAKEMALYNKRMLRDHATGHGKRLPAYLVHASTIVLLKTLTARRSNVRPKIGIHVANQLC